MWRGNEMEGYSLEPFWGEVFHPTEVATVIWFFQFVSLGEEIETFSTMEEAILILKADIDLRIPDEYDRLLPNITIYI